MLLNNYRNKSSVAKPECFEGVLLIDIRYRTRLYIYLFGEIQAHFCEEQMSWLRSEK